MGCAIEVLFTPAEFHTLRQRNLAGTTCVVFDVLRATSSIVTALAHGAAGVVPVEEISDALTIRRHYPDALLAGEREGLRIKAAMSGAVDFELGNSPHEYESDKVAGKTIISTTTNGTRALRACAGAACVVAGSFLNLSATAQYIILEKPGQLVLVCAGTNERAALEDALAAGALCAALAQEPGGWDFFDSAWIARRLFQQAETNLAQAVYSAENARRLLANAELRDDVDFCLRRDAFPITAIMGRDGIITRV